MRTMKKNNNETVMVIGIDHGYGNMKTATRCFPSGVARYDKEPIFQNNLLVYNGMYYQIGEEHKEFCAEKTQDEDYYVLTLAAIARELDGKGMNRATVHIAAGLPLTWVATQKEDFQKYLLQNESVDFAFRNKDYHVEFAGADIYPQGFAAAFYRLQDFKGINMLVDIGNGTMNIMYINNSRPLEKNDLFIQLNEWNKEFDTENKEFKEIRTKVMEGNVDAQNPWNTSQIKKWLECKPVELEKYRLEKYFYLTRENLKRSSIDESGFSKNTKEILERIGRAKSGQMVAIIKDMEKLRAEEIADTFKVVVSKIEKGEMKFFVVRDLFLNFDAYKGKIVDAIGKSTVPIKAGDMAALRTMYNSDTGNMNTVLETMVKRGTLTDEQITEIKEQRKS